VAFPTPAQGKLDRNQSIKRQLAACINQIVREIIMRRFAIVAVSLAFSASIVFAQTAQPAQEGNLNLSLGERDFRTYCAPCHGLEGKGDGVVAEFLAIEPANLTLLKRNNAGKFPRDRVAETIDGRREVRVHGARDMPVWGDWFKAEANNPGLKDASREAAVQSRIDNLLLYLESIQGK
jgi:mono/diheme cytochrome c family protein